MDLALEDLVNRETSSSSSAQRRGRSEQRRRVQRLDAALEEQGDAVLRGGLANVGEALEGELDDLVDVS